MERIVPRAIETYIDRLADRGGDRLASLERSGLREGWPIVGAAEGGFLHLLARMVGARRVLELGTAIGYSASWFARAVGEDGRVITIEGNPDSARVAMNNIADLGLSERVEVKVGRAEVLLRTLRGEFDLVFNDIDKVAYPLVYEDCVRLLRVGGLLVTDNVLWSGEVAGRSRSKETVAIRAYNERLAHDARFISSILPLRDGVSVALKVGR